MNSTSTRGMAALIAGWALFAASHAAQAAELTLYENADFGGRQLTLRGWTPNIGVTGFNDRTSSIVVSSGRWEVCTDVAFNGNCAVIGPGNYPNIGGLGQALSSLRRVR